MNRRWEAALVSGLVGLVLVASAAAARAADSAPTTPRLSGQSEDLDYAAARKAIEAGDFAAAIPLLEKVVARDGANADTYNSLAYATRRNGDPTRSIPLYQKALALDPKHRGAHEYIGEAYLALGDIAKAREHLATLDRLCFLPCAEYRDLKKAIEAFQARGR